MAQFEKNETGCTITDDSGQSVHLSDEAAYELLRWLYTQNRAELTTTNNQQEEEAEPEDFVAGQHDRLETRHLGLLSKEDYDEEEGDE